MTLQLYIFRQLLTSFALSVGGIGLVVVPTIGVQAIHKLGGASILGVLQYLPLVLGELVPYLLPMAFLLAVVATYGKLEADNELLAIRMAGIHPVRVLLPGVFISIVLGIGTNWILGDFTPNSKYEQRNFLRRTAVDELRGLVNDRTEFDLGSLYVKAARADGHVKHEVLVHALDETGNDMTLVADQAAFLFQGDALVVEFQGVQVLTENANTFMEHPKLVLPLDEIAPVVLKDRSNAKYIPSSDIHRMLERGEVPPEDEREFIFEVHRRRALAATYILFLLLGVPTGVALRSGTQLGAFAGAIGYAFLYYLLAMRLGKELGRMGVIPPVFAAWLTNGIFAVAGILAGLRVVRR